MATLYNIVCCLSTPFLKKIQKYFADIPGSLENRAFPAIKNLQVGSFDLEARKDNLKNDLE
jgi:hypothetical protein